MKFNIFIFIFGLIAGSFLNVVVCRLKTNETIVVGRSHCPRCKKKLNWYELIPIVSFAIQLGRCRKCRKKISWQYPLMELATGIIFLAVFNFLFLVFDKVASLEFIITNVFWFVIFGYLIIIFVYDLKHYLVASIIIYPAIIITFLYRVLEVFEFKSLNLIGTYILASAIASGFFLAIVLISKGKWMGMGDVKIGFLMGLILGFPRILVALFLAFLIGAAFSLVLIALKKKNLKSQIPFGPFLVFATMFALFFGDILLNWYLKLI